MKRGTDIVECYVQQCPCALLYITNLCVNQRVNDWMDWQINSSALAGAREERERKLQNGSSSSCIRISEQHRYIKCNCYNQSNRISAQ